MIFFVSLCFSFLVKDAIAGNFFYPQTQKPRVTSTVFTPSQPQPSIMKAVLPKTQFIVDIVPHQADYTVELGTNGNPDVSDIKGWMQIQLLNSGDGFDMRQTSNLIIYNAVGGADQMITKLKTWESYDASRFSFECATVQNGTEAEEIKGILQRQNVEAASTITYTAPKASTVVLDKGVILPLQLTKYIISLAHENNLFPKTFTVLVFDGTSDSQEPVKVDGVIHRLKDPKIILNDDGVAPKKTSFEPQNAYPVDMDIYSATGRQLEPEYHISQVILDGGIIKEIAITRDGYTVKASISNLTFFDHSPKLR